MADGQIADGNGGVEKGIKKSAAQHPVRPRLSYGANHKWETAFTKSHYHKLPMAAGDLEGKHGLASCPTAPVLWSSGSKKINIQIADAAIPTAFSAAAGEIKKIILESRYRRIPFNTTKIGGKNEWAVRPAIRDRQSIKTLNCLIASQTGECSPTSYRTALCPMEYVFRKLHDMSPGNAVSGCINSKSKESTAWHPARPHLSYGVLL